jgi:hypothetical protein
LSTTVKLSASLFLGTRSRSLHRSSSLGKAISEDFELAPGAVRQIALDSSHDGTSLVFLCIGAVLNSDGKTPAVVSYGVSDAAASNPSDPQYSANWIDVDGLEVSWRTIALSTQNRIYIYNSGAAKINVSLVIGVS